MKKKNIEVSPKGDKWQVKRQNSQKASKLFDTQKEAISYGKPIAKKEHTEFVIKNRKGQIREKDSYGNDPFPPKG